jgi:hypothetical protein
MQLGQFLECEQGEPSCFEPVEFYLSRKTPTGKKRIRVKANLYPVSESERRAARKAATAYLRATPRLLAQGRNQPSHSAGRGGFRDDSALLVAALYDAEDPMVQFVGAGDYSKFRDGILGSAGGYALRAVPSVRGSRVSGAGDPVCGP